MSYVLILTIITSYGAVATQKVHGFSSYDDCVARAVSWGDTQPVNPGDQIKWDCQKEE